MAAVVKTLKIRIKDSSLRNFLKEKSVSVNIVWNYCNETSFHAIRYNEEFLSGYQLNNLTSGSCKDLKISATTVQEVCERFAVRRASCKKRKLRFRGKGNLGWVPFKSNGFYFKNAAIFYCGRKIKVFQPERLPQKGQYGSGEFCEDSLGRWYFCLTVKSDSPSPVEIRQSVGIDLGISTLATCSDGKKIENRRFYKNIAKLDAIFNRQKRYRALRLLHLKSKNQRSDFLHKQSSLIAKNFQMISVGNLNASSLIKSGSGKSVNDASFYTFKTMLKYKANALGHYFVEVDESFTTRVCSTCSNIADSAPKGRKGLSIREWVCEICNTFHERDTNAAINILRLGQQALASEGIQVLQ